MVLARGFGRLEVFPIRGAARELPVRIHAGLYGVELRLHGPLRRLLHVEVERRVDAQAALVQVPPEARVELDTQPLDEIGGDVAVVGAVPGEHQRVRLPQLGLLRRQEALVAHQAEHHVAPAHGALRMRPRVIERRQLGERRQGGRLGDVQLLRVLPEVDLRGSLDAVGPGSEVDLVQVQLEDRVLGEVAFDLHRHPRFLELAGEGLLAADLLREDVARQLHRDGREPLGEAHRQEVVLDGAHDAPIVDPVVIVEALVLGRDERLAHRQRDFGQRQHGPPLGAELADEAPVCRVHLRRLDLDLAAGSLGIQPRDARAVLARAHPGPGAVGKAQHIGAREHRDRDHAAADLGLVPPGERPGERHGRGRGDGRHRVTT